MKSANEPRLGSIQGMREDGWRRIVGEGEGAAGKEMNHVGGMWAD